jgi:hypothetical protein
MRRAMNFNKVELETIEQLSMTTEQAIKELDSLELSLVGGGCGDPILA